MEHVMSHTGTKRYAVVGADNFIGRRLLGALGPHGCVDSIPAQRSPRDLHRVVVNADVVVVCDMSSPASIVASMQSVIDAARHSNRAPRVVNLSSMAVYGSAQGLILESHASEGALSGYAAARVTAERIASAHSRVVTLRPGCEYGPGCTLWSERVARWLAARRLGDLGANGDGYCNLLYIDDLVTAVVRAADLPDIDGQTFNLAGDAPPTWNEYFTRFAIALGAVPVRRVTRRRLQIETKLLAIPLKLTELLASRAGLRRSPLPTAIPPSLLHQFRQEARLDTQKAKRLLGMKWTAIETGLRAAATTVKTA